LYFKFYIIQICDEDAIREKYIQWMPEIQRLMSIFDFRIQNNPVIWF